MLAAVSFGSYLSKALIEELFSVSLCFGCRYSDLLPGTKESGNFAMLNAAFVIRDPKIPASFPGKDPATSSTGHRRPPFCLPR
jgi:hypothetical protein